MSENYDERRADYEVAVDEALRSAWKLLEALDAGEPGWVYGAEKVLRARLMLVAKRRREKAVAA